MSKNPAYFIVAALSYLACGAVLAAADFAGKEEEIRFTSSFDSSEQVAVLYTPPEREKNAKAPLLLHLHYLNGNRFTARKLGYYAEADKRGWLVLSPELHGANTPGGKTSYGALPAQHDAIDALDIVLSTHDNVDPRRLYLAGRSMGGMLALLLAAKYPDRFAGVVAGQPITDVKAWLQTSALMENSQVRNMFLQEMGGMPEAAPFEYARRSALNYARNLAYLPVLIWSGTVDTWVSPDQSERMMAAIRSYNKYQPQVEWLVGAAHCPQNFTAEWVCDRLKYWENAPEAGVHTLGRHYSVLSIITDESKKYFHLEMEVADGGAFGELQSEISGDTVYLKSRNLQKITVDVQQAAGKRMNKESIPSLQRYHVESDRPMRTEFLFGTQSVVVPIQIGLSEGAISW